MNAQSLFCLLLLLVLFISGSSCGTVHGGGGVSASPGKKEGMTTADFGKTTDTSADQKKQNASASSGPESKIKVEVLETPVDANNKKKKNDDQQNTEDYDEDDVVQQNPHDQDSSPSISPPTMKMEKKEEDVIPPLDYEQWVEDTVKKTLGNRAAGDVRAGAVNEEKKNGELDPQPEMEEDYEEERDHYAHHIQKAEAEGATKDRMEKVATLAKAMRIQNQIDDLNRDLGVQRAKLQHKQRVHLSKESAARNKKCQNLPAFWYHALSSPGAGGRNFFPAPNPLEISEAQELLALDAERMTQEEKATPPGKKPEKVASTLYEKGKSGPVMEQVREALEDGKTLMSDHEVFANYLKNIQCFHIPAEVSQKDKEARAFLLSQSILGKGDAKQLHSKSKSASHEELPDWAHRTIVVSSDDEEGQEGGDEEKLILSNVKQPVIVEDPTMKTKTEVSPEETLDSDVSLPAELQYAMPSSEKDHHLGGADEDRYRLVMQFQDDVEKVKEDDRIQWYYKKGSSDKTLYFVNKLVKGDQAPKQEEKKQMKSATMKRLGFPLRETLLVKDVAVSAAHTFNDVVESFDPETGEPTRQWRNAGLGQGTRLSLRPSESSQSKNKKQNRQRQQQQQQQQQPSASSSSIKQGVALVNQTVFRAFMAEADFNSLPLRDQESVRQQLHVLIQAFCVHSNANYLAGYENDVSVRGYELTLNTDRKLQEEHAANIKAQAEGYRRGSEEALALLKATAEEPNKEDL